MMNAVLIGFLFIQGLAIIRLLLVIERTVRAPGGILPPIQPLEMPWKKKPKSVQFLNRNDKEDNLVDLDKVDPAERERAMQAYLDHK